MFRKIFFTIIILAILIVVSFWSPWERYNLTFSRLFGVEKVVGYSGLEVFSLKGSMRVYLDDVEKGTVSPESDALVVSEITPGVHVLRISRGDSEQNEYYEIVKSINFFEGLNVIAAYELGPTKEFSQGHVFYARREKGQEGDNSNLNIVLENSDNVTIYLDESKIGVAPINNYALDLDKIHKLKLVSDGYETLEFNILPDSEEDRSKLKGVDLFIEAHLFLIPINLDSNNQ